MIVECHDKIMENKIELVSFNENLLFKIWEIGFKSENPEWSKWDAPYFEEYQAYDMFEDFRMTTNLLKPNKRCILFNNEPVGMVSHYWENQKTRWMEIGICIFDESLWGQGIGSKALSLWTDLIFEEFKELEHLGLTTWSGNKPMMKLAEKIGYKLEARIRKVRYWQGIYHDSVKYGVLREEWEQIRK